MTVTESQNYKFTNNYVHFTLMGAPCPTLPYNTPSFDAKQVIPHYRQTMFDLPICR